MTGKNKKRVNKEPLSKVIIHLRCQLTVQQQQFEAQERRITSLKEEKNRLHSSIAYWKDMTEKKGKNASSDKQTRNKKNESLHIGIIDAITSVVTQHFPRFGVERVGKEIAKAALSRDLFRGVGLTKMLNYFHDELREKVVVSHRILREMDLSSGSLNYTAIEILKKVENLSGKKWFRGIIPSPTTIRKVFRAIETKADLVIPI
eukprot:scaffold38967_cov54-Attheya_sp.AAC.2